MFRLRKICLNQNWILLTFFEKYVQNIHQNDLFLKEISFPKKLSKRVDHKSK